MHWAALHDPNAESLEALREAGADIEAQDSLGQTPLHMAASRGNASAIGFLLAAGADVNARQKGSAFTALHEAASWGDPEALRALLDAGADVNAREVWSNSIPLHFAVQNVRGATGVVAALLEAGADLSVRNNLGKTALEMAVLHGTSEIAGLVGAAAGQDWTAPEPGA